MTSTFTIRTTSTATAQRLFDLSLDVGEHVRSMAGSGERAVDGVTSGAITLGESVTWRAWHLGVRWTMTSCITALEAPHSFTDEQVRGPFRSFRHVHTFEAVDGATVMTDHVSLASPILGRAAERLVLVPYLRRLLRRRARHLVATAEQAG